MNKRMRELLAQASGRPLETVNQMTWDFEEKFAELIVRECAEACEKNSYLALNGWQRAKQILNHFGVDQ